MTPPEEWSPESLSLLDSLWGARSTMLVIRRRLHPLLGFYASPDQVMTMVRRPKKPAAEIIPPRVVFEKIATKRFCFEPPPRQENAVRLVVTKTHKAPTGGFTMLGGKK